MRTILIPVMLLAVFCCNCTGQTKTKKMKNDTNPMLCDTTTGACGAPPANDSRMTQDATNREKQIKIIYYTDPICSSCWGIEPQLRKMKLEYGADLEVEYRMGGLLPDWNYNSGGISKPADVATHWNEASSYYDMPIDGSIWLTDPLSSSYPPSIAFKAAEIQSPEKAITFLRIMREMVFMRKVNIALWKNIEQAATTAGLNTTQLRADYDGMAKVLFEQDLALARKLGVRGFPTMFFVNRQGKQELLYGSRTYADFERTILKLNPAATKKEIDTTWQNLFSLFPTLTSREYAELSGTPRKEADIFLQKLCDAGQLKKTSVKLGNLWERIIPAK